MEITVTELGSPLLFERLNACATPRQRAAVFKACAEAHLREGLIRGTPAPERYAPTSVRNDLAAVESAREETNAAGRSDVTRQTASNPVKPPGSGTTHANEPGAGFPAVVDEKPRDMSADFINRMSNGLADFF
ncbi:hypothetical protein [Paraburkholderia sp. J8-2]|uniref:hypothetical protein n=1 Tax=Paraburkholderia sp. J8-2 TaxID=2805440 RepID=UPI002AB6896C|nr:hypothetical protein [Paraburkholderia sp. J8-2]